MILKVATYNTWDYGQHQDEPRADLVHKVIRQLVDDGVHLIAAQELYQPRDLLTLAEEAGLTCYYDPPWWDEDEYSRGRIAAAAANGQSPVKHHVGLLWDPKVMRARPDTWRSFPDFWHNLAVCDFDVDGLVIRAGSYHGPPFGRNRRCDEAERVVSVMTRPYAEHPRSLIGGDWNSISADRVKGENGQSTYWHPEPFDEPWREPYVYQCEVLSEASDGTPVHWHADRRPGQVLLRAGIRDTAALTGTPWVPTVGHADHADMGSRAIDTWRTSSNLAPAVIDHQVVDNPLTRAASDHLPVVATLDLSRLP